MDKETLSNYGWIVVLVLILAVMLALATPFGTFIAGAIKSTTAGLFNVNQAALGSAGIDVNDMVFENCDHVETEIRNATDTYTGDTCCKNCGKVIATGQTVKAKIPEGGYYYVGVTDNKTVEFYSDYTNYTAKYGPGDEFPETVSDGDIYRYDGYEYRYNQYITHPSNSDNTTWAANTNQGGWGVRVINLQLSTYSTILSSVNGKPVVTLRGTFFECESMVTAPAIPNTVTDLTLTFEDCYMLKLPPAIPDSVTNMTGTFSYCKAMTEAPVLPDGLTSLYNTFSNCHALVSAPTIPDSVTNLGGTFFQCAALNTYVGNADGIGDFSKYKIPLNTTSMEGTFNGCSSLVIAPVIPNKVTNMGATFRNCSKLTGAPVIPNSVTNMQGTFKGCTSLQTAPTIPSNVTLLYDTFYDCTALTGTLEINTNSTSYFSCFYHVDFESQNLKLIGSSTKLDLIGATGTNYCAECNGCCKGGH